MRLDKPNETGKMPSSLNRPQDGAEMESGMQEYADNMDTILENHSSSRLVWNYAVLRKTGRKYTLVYSGVAVGSNPDEALLDAMRTAYNGEVVVIGGNRYRVWETPNGIWYTRIDPAKRNRKGDRSRHREFLASLLNH